MAEILVLGGGFGGLAAAHELRSLLPEEHTITVLARDDRFFVGFAKLWDLVGARPLAEGTRSLTGLEGAGITFRETEIVTVHPDSHTVGTSDGMLRGDYLVVALGAEHDRTQTRWLSGAAHDLYDPGALDAMRAALEGFEEGRLLIGVLGVPYVCPPAPYEAAFLLDGWLRERGRRDAVDLTVAAPMPGTLPVAGEAASRQVAEALEECGVEVLLERRVSGVDAEGRVVRFEDHDPESYDLLFAVPRHVPPRVLIQSGLTAESGWIEPDPATLRTEHEGIYAVGDCTLVPTAAKPLPKAGVFAAAQGRTAARNIAAEIEGGEGDTYDGHGFCFLEFPGGRAAYVQGDFFAEPAPAVELSPPDRETMEAKEAFEREQLDTWLPA